MRHLTTLPRLSRASNINQPTLPLQSTQQTNLFPKRSSPYPTNSIHHHLFHKTPHTIKFLPHSHPASSQKYYSPTARAHTETKTNTRTSASMATPTSAAAGLLGRQFKQMQTDKDIPGISCGLVDSNVFEWEVMLMISDDCKYYGGMSTPQFYPPIFKLHTVQSTPGRGGEIE